MQHVILAIAAPTHFGKSNILS